MDGSSLPGQVRRVENIKWSFSVSLLYVNNKGGVNNPLFKYISVCYVKSLEWVVGVEAYYTHYFL